MVVLTVVQWNANHKCPSTNHKCPNDRWTCVTGLLKLNRILKPKGRQADGRGLVTNIACGLRAADAFTNSKNNSEQNLQRSA